jgi:hypothetical protein
MAGVIVAGTLGAEEPDPTEIGQKSIGVALDFLAPPFFRPVRARLQLWNGLGVHDDGHVNGHRFFLRRQFFQIVHENDKRTKLDRESSPEYVHSRKIDGIAPAYHVYAGRFGSCWNAEGALAMPYRVTLTFVGGDRTRGLEIYQGPTPNLGDKISVKVKDGSTSAKVTGIRRHPSRSPGSAVENGDDVDAQEL